MLHNCHIIHYTQRIHQCLGISEEQNSMSTNNCREYFAVAVNAHIWKYQTTNLKPTYIRSSMCTQAHTMNKNNYRQQWCLLCERLVFECELEKTMYGVSTDERRLAGVNE